MKFFCNFFQNPILSKSQQEKFPEALEAHRRWESGLLDVKKSEVLVPGMQKAVDYYDHMEEFLDSLDEEHINVLVGTRSDTSCVMNVFNGGSPEVDMAYKYYPFSYAQAYVATKIGDENYHVTEIKQKEKGKGE